MRSVRWPVPSGSDVPGWLRKLVIQGLEREPDARHADMRALLDALVADPAETTNVYRDHPEIVEQLKERLREIREANPRSRS